MERALSDGSSGYSGDSDAGIGFALCPGPGSMNFRAAARHTRRTGGDPSAARSGTVSPGASTVYGTVLRNATYASWLRCGTAPSSPGS